jgi:hypothetical protein
VERLRKERLLFSLPMTYSVLTLRKNINPGLLKLSNKSHYYSHGAGHLYVTYMTPALIATTAPSIFLSLIVSVHTILHGINANTISINTLNALTAVLKHSTTSQPSLTGGHFPRGCSQIHSLEISQCCTHCIIPLTANIKLTIIRIDHTI